MTTQQPEAVDLADWLEAVGGGPSAKRCAALLREQHARIAELEAQLESIGAGGVSGPLIGQPQAMPDLSQLTERGAVAWAGVDAQGFRDGVASVSAGSEPVAWQYRGVRNKGLWFDCTEERAKQRAAHPDKWDVRYLYTHPSPPEGMAGWQPIETAPKDGSRILLHPAVEVADDWSKGHWNSEHQCWIVGGSPSGVVHTAWHHLPAAPGHADGESNE